MSTTTSKLGKKYDRKEIEKLDKQFHSELRKMFRKSNCADCGKKHPNWATLKRGKFVCINCAQKLRADSSNRVKSCMGTYLWHPDEMEVMREGCKSSQVSEYRTWMALSNDFSHIVYFLQVRILESTFVHIHKYNFFFFYFCTNDTHTLYTNAYIPVL